jgi:hypothetical protein
MSMDVQKHVMPVALEHPTLLSKLQEILTEDELEHGVSYVDVNDEGRALPTQTNLLIFLKKCNIVFCYDEFALKTYVINMPAIRFWMTPASMTCGLPRTARVFVSRRTCCGPTCGRTRATFACIP